MIQLIQLIHNNATSINHSYANYLLQILLKSLPKLIQDEIKYNEKNEILSNNQSNESDSYDSDDDDDESHESEETLNGERDDNFSDENNNNNNQNSDFMPAELFLSDFMDQNDKQRSQNNEITHISDNLIYNPIKTDPYYYIELESYIIDNIYQLCSHNSNNSGKCCLKCRLHFSFSFVFCCLILLFFVFVV